MTPPIQSGYVNHVINQNTKNASVSKAAGGTVGGLVVKSAVNEGQRIGELLKPSAHPQPPADIDFALLSKKAYGRNNQERQVEGFDILPQHTTEDRVVYRHQKTGYVVVAFRGTDLHDTHQVTSRMWKRNPIKALSHEFETRHFRDVTTDIALALGIQGAASHRFYNAEVGTQRVINEFGKNNVSVTGHSLGGSQAMHVSNKLGVHAEVYNPHISWNDAGTHTNFFHTNVHVNATDPISTFFPGIRAEHIDVRYNRKAKPFMGQHGIDNFLKSTTKSKTFIPAKTPTAPKSNISKTVPVRSVAAHPPISQYSNYGGGHDLAPLTMNCSSMSHYQKVLHGCPRRTTVKA